MAKDGGWLLPADPSTEDLTCIRITLPNDPNYRRAFWGALWELTFYSHWQQGDQATLDIVVKRMEDMWWNAVEAWSPEAQGACEVFDIRVIGGMLQKSYNGGLDWLDVSPISVGNPIQSVETNTLPPGSDATAQLVSGVLTLGIPQGAQGAMGATGAQGIQGIQGLPGVNGTAGAAGADATTPVGTILYWGGEETTIPDGWLRCNGAALDPAEYWDLFNVIDYFYGSAGGGLFNLPNLENLYIKGLGNSENLYPLVTGGAATVTLTTAQMPTHAHPHTHTADHNHAVNIKNNGTAGGGARLMAALNASGTDDTRNTQSASVVTSEDTTAAGSGEAHENEPPYIKLIPIIRATKTDINVEFRIVDCDLQWRKDGGAWSTLVDLSTCATPGPQGEQGATGATGGQGVQGAQGLPGDCNCGDAPPPIDNTDATHCGIAKEIVATMNSTLDDTMEQLDAEGEIGATIGKIVGGAFGLTIQIDYLTQTVTDAFNTSTSIIRGDITQTMLEELECDLYVRLKAAGGYSFSVIGQWYFDFVNSGDLSIGKSFLFLMLKVFDETFWNRHAYIGSLSPSNECGGCEEEACPDQSYGFSSPDGEGQPGATWEGLTGITFANPCNVAQIGYEVDAGREVTMVYPAPVTFGMLGNGIDISYIQPDPDDNVAPTIEIEGVEYTSSGGATVQCGLDYESRDREYAIPTPVVSDRFTIKFNTAEARYLRRVQAPICPQE